MADSEVITKQVWSAGGVVVQRGTGDPSQYQVVICGRRADGHWGLPKGTPEATDADARATALREVQEETGIQAEILADAGVTAYTFYRQAPPDGEGVSANGAVAEQVRYEKEVFFYVMKPLGGCFSEHDSEYDVVEWEEWNEAVRRLTHAAEADVVKKSIQICRDTGLI